VYICDQIERACIFTGDGLRAGEQRQRLMESLVDAAVSRVSNAAQQRDMRCAKGMRSSVRALVGPAILSACGQREK
jgi:hypothetical protein